MNGYLVVFRIIRTGTSQLDHRLQVSPRVGERDTPGKSIKRWMSSRWLYAGGESAAAAKIAVAIIIRKSVVVAVGCFVETPFPLASGRFDSSELKHIILQMAK